jgi:hypothetical protein
MNLSSINIRVVSSLCLTSLAVGIAIPAMTVNPPEQTPPTTAPSKVAPTNKTPSSTPPIPATTPTTPTTTKIPPLVVVPPLTPTTLTNFTSLYGQVIEIELTPNQQRKIQQRLSKQWMTNLGLRNTVSQTIAMESQIVNGTPAERDRIQSQLVGNLRQQVLDGDKDALWLVSFYDASSKHWLAPGEPPLTKMTADISADALCFMVNEVMGKSVTTPDREIKNAIAAKLKNEYANVSENTKQELARLPGGWLRFKDEDWVRRGDDFREQMRVHWGKNLEAYIPEIKAMSQLRRDRLAKLKADPNTPWENMNPIQRQAALQRSDANFQNNARALAPAKTVQLYDRIWTMEVANTIGNSPTSYSLKLRVK